MTNDYTRFPWESTEPLLELPAARADGVIPERMSIVTVTHARARELAQQHVRRTTPKIDSAEARKGFEHGAGMFDFPAPSAELDDLLG